MKGKGLVNSLINKLPIELHLPGYNYCGPGTKLKKRLLRGDKGVNLLDEACKQHDIAYDKFNNLEDRHKADFLLMNMAKKRLHSSNSSKGEKISSWLVNKVMKAKLKTGGGIKKFKNIISKIHRDLKKRKCVNHRNAINYAHTAAKKLFGKADRINMPRVIPVPKTGGILPLIPIFAGLSALGALAGGASSIAKTVNDYKVAKKNFEESSRHNKVMEKIALGKGLYLKPFKNGYGLFIQRSKN